jgi:DNA-binding XRE family transcriptional regulator
MKGAAPATDLPNRPFSKAELFDELQNVLDQYFEKLADWFAPEFVDRLSGGDSQKYEIRSLPIGTALGALYDYGIGAVLESNDDPYMRLHSASLFVTEVVSIQTSTSEVRTDPPLCARVVDTAMARWELDMTEPRTVPLPDELGATPTGCLTVRQVALLANMDEKSVRNATYEKSEDRLRTFIRGGRAYVEASEARRWLAARRGYRPTRLAPSRQGLGAEIPAAGFCTSEEVAEFIDRRRNQLHLDRAALAKRIGDPNVTEQTLNYLEAGAQWELSLPTLVALGKALEVNPKQFALAAAHGYIVDDYREDAA